MILSKLTLDWKSIKACSLGTPYGIHKFVYSLFPRDAAGGGEEGDGRAEAGRHFLFAVSDAKECGKEILILSRDVPAKPERGALQSKPVPADYLDADEYAFQIQLNPSKRAPNGKMVPVVGNQAAKEWFLEKQASWGFSASQDSLEVRGPRAEVFCKGRQTITLAKAIFKGVLRVEDRAAFKRSFENGIGKAKAFGFGLLQLIKIK